MTPRVTLTPGPLRLKRNIITAFNSLLTDERRRILHAIHATGIVMENLLLYFSFSLLPVRYSYYHYARIVSQSYPYYSEFNFPTQRAYRLVGLAARIYHFNS